ncbi:c-type cytochrome [Pseudomonas sp. S1Bt23]|uniref:c-type cytochrome n=1 Tax=Pseudomonas sp. S1Bt23 TaxID=3095074 RepID=UPI002A5A6877|nr:c-type cytochrome [Pseudomonas sp. S1Bt23]WPO46641.1 c-type cytochrome [Pseudomonas sp. S1Bt23]
MKFLVGFVVASFFCVANLALAGGDEYGMMAGNGCVNCHGVEGRGTTVGNIPPLKGRSKEFLVTAMEGYKTGTLHGTVMNRVMKDFDAQKIDVLATYFSSIK